MLLLIVCILLLYIKQSAAFDKNPEVFSSFNPSDSVPTDTVLKDSHLTPLFSFKASNVDFMRAMKLFAQTNGFELISNTKYTGSITVEFENKTIEESMNCLLSGKKISWKLENNDLILSPCEQVIKNLQSIDAVINHIPDSSIADTSVPLTVKDLGESRLFKINYPRLKRSGQGSSSANISSAASGQAGSIQLSTGDEIIFWQELEDQLKELISSKGKLIVNKLAGVIFISDDKAQLEIVQEYLEAVTSASTRQVEITARIYEITLNKDKSMGVDWNNIAASLTSNGYRGLLNGAGNVIANTPEYKTSTLELDASMQNKFDAILRALKEEGDVRTISQPRVVTINNQPALVKIGTDMPFFSANVTLNTTTGNKEIQEEVRVITVGLVLSVTPQISQDGWITLGIDPLISDLVSTKESSNGSTAPVIDVKQSSSLVRLKDRQTVRISGLLQTKRSTNERKIPLLGDIPVLKYLFKWKYTKETRKELVIFITPRIL
jgi:MSHA type pilus biogenesis protein MshL